ncbi:MAG: hypothetical protein ACLQCB_03700 [Spirochaetia bacterium]
MLAEIRGARQIPAEGFRRWFADDDFDLIVWYDNPPPPDAAPGALAALKGFQLCYDKTGKERALSWTREHGFQHSRIDSGEVPGHAKMTPVIIADGEFGRDAVAKLFKKESSKIDPALARFVYSAVKAYPRKPNPPRA